MRLFIGVMLLALYGAVQADTVVAEDSELRDSCATMVTDMPDDQFEEWVAFTLQMDEIRLVNEANRLREKTSQQ